MKGQMSLVALVLTGAFALTGTVITSWATANTRVASIDTQVKLVEKTEALHYLELRKDLARIESKLDQIIKER